MVPQQSVANQTKERSISFSDQKVVHEILHIDDFDDDEIDACWYFEEEYLAMKQDVDDTLSQIKENRPVDEIRQSLRGIEGKVESEDREGKKYAQIASILAVLTEQESFRNRLQHPDEGILSIVYRRYTQESQLSAYLTGIADEQYVRPVTSPFMSKPKKSPKRKSMTDKSLSPRKSIPNTPLRGRPCPTSKRRFSLRVPMNLFSCS
mmetsp:Transcript_112426/g.157635  ORF Transcript_112426/g.157635 Transcript_112426/m.157635 type:complete len:207 (-) Transcript_112426:120-740(-)